MVRTLISYTLAAGIVTPPALLSTQPPPQLEVQSSVSQYPLLRTAQPIQLDTHPIPHNPPTVIPQPIVLPTPQTIAPQFVARHPDPVPIPTLLEDLPSPEPPPEPTAITEPPIPTVNPDVSPVVALPPPIETSDVETPEIPSPPTDLTVLQDIVHQAQITSTAPLSAYDIMSGERLWETTESLTVQASNHQVLLDDQAHTELILIVPNNEFITVNGTDYPGGLIIRAQEDELYVINYLSGDQMMTIQPEVVPESTVFSEQTFTLIAQSESAHHWYDLDGRLPEQPPQISRRGSP
ncbi:MAG: hypothetical protein AAF572_21350 [Cyanobacteria bacterium P01_B01_bin.77]